MSRPPPISRAHVYRKLTNYTRMVMSDLNWMKPPWFVPHPHMCWYFLVWTGGMAIPDYHGCKLLCHICGGKKRFPYFLRNRLYYNIIKAAVSFVSFYPLRLYSWKMNNMKIKLVIEYEFARPKKSCEVCTSMLSKVHTFNFFFLTSYIGGS